MLAPIITPVGEFDDCETETVTVLLLVDDIEDVEGVDELA